MCEFLKKKTNMRYGSFLVLDIEYPASGGDDDGDGDIVVTFWGWHLMSDSYHLPPKITLGDSRW